MFGTYLLIFLLFLLEFVVLPFGTSQYEIPRVIVAESLIIIFFFSKLLNKNFSFKKIKKDKLIISSVFLLLSLIHLIFFRSEITFFGNIFRLQGVFLLWNLLIIYLFSENLVPKQIGALSFLALVGQLFFAVITPFNSSGRAVGTLGEPNSLAASIIFLWPFVFLLNKNIFIKIFSVVCASLIVFLTSSRSGMFALIFQLLFLVLNNQFKLETKKILIIVLVLIALSYVLPFFEVFPYESRREVWISSFSAGLSKPIFGFGFGNAEGAIKKSSTILNLPIQRNYVDSSHNIFLDFFVQGGLIGLLTFVFAIRVFLKNALKQKKVINLVLFIGLITCLSFNPVSIYLLIAFWWLLGLPSGL